MLQLYMDENVHGAITQGLKARGVDALTVQDDDRGKAPDDAVLDRAAELGRALFTQDADLLIEAPARQRAGQSFAAVIYAHQTRVSIGRCVEDLELIASAGELEEIKDQVTYLPL